MHPCFLDMLHDARNDDVRSVGDGVHVDLDGIFEIPVHQHRPLGRGLHRAGHVVPDALLVVHDLHGPAAQHIGRADHHRVPDSVRRIHRLVARDRRAALGLQQSQLVEQFLEALAVLGTVDAVRRGPENAHLFFFERHRKFERRLSAELHDHADGLLSTYNM